MWGSWMDPMRLLVFDGICVYIVQNHSVHPKDMFTVRWGQFRQAKGNEGRLASLTSSPTTFTM